MKIVMAHGSGGDMTSALINDIFGKTYGNDYLSQMEDATVVPGATELTMTTDSFVVKPLEFPGGDIGRLAICGTVNDLAMRGSTPKFLTCGFILEEGLEFDSLEKICISMAETANEAGVKIVAGDTKVVEGNGGMFINTAGVGYKWKRNVSAVEIEEGDVIILSGNIGDHHAAILSSRLGIDNSIKSDCAPLCMITENLNSEGINVHAMRDITRGGLATVLSEIAEKSKNNIEIYEEKIPVDDEVKSFAGLMGLEPLYMGNEGKMVVIVPKEEADKTVDIIRKYEYGRDAVVIGEILAKSDGKVTLITEIGGRRRLSALTGEGLPRIC